MSLIIRHPSVLELKFAKQISELPTVIPVKAGIQKLVTRLPAMPYAMNKGQEKKVLDNRQRTAVNRATMGKKAIILLVSLTLASVHLVEARNRRKSHGS